MSVLRVKSLIPRGLSRFYLLHFLEQCGPLTGKELMNEAESRSDGTWKPSPGLVYPLLGRLLSEGLIVESEGGKYQLTEKGRTVLKDFVNVKQQFDKQAELVRRLGLLGRLLVEDVFTNLGELAAKFRDELAKTPSKTQHSLAKRYKQFLEKELQRLNEAPQNSG